MNPRLCLALVLLVAALVRVWGVDFGLPYLLHPDEPNKISMARQMFVTGDLNPHYFKKPTLFIYLNALLYVPYYWVGKVVGSFTDPSDVPAPQVLTMGVGEMTPGPVVMARLLTVGFGVVGVYLTYRLSRAVLVRQDVSLLSALLLAISPTHVANSRYITVNVFLTASVVAVAWASYKLYQRGRLVDYAVAGSMCGLAVSFKYPGAIVLVVPVLAHLLRSGRHGSHGRLVLGLAMVPVVFAVLTPFAVLDHPQFLADTVYELKHYSTGHPGMEGQALKWYVNYAWRLEGPVFVLAVVWILRGLLARDRTTQVVAAFPVIYFGFISSFVVRNDRTFLPLVPFLCIFSAAALVHVLHRCRASRHAVGCRAMRWLGRWLVAVCAGVLLANTLRAGVWLQRPTSRERGATWANANLAAGSKIAVESYGPFLSRDAFRVYGVKSAIDHPLEWYVQEGFDYLFLSEGFYGRYYADPDTYGAEIQQYKGLFGEFPLVATIPGSDYDLSVLRVAP